eukprot:2653776-Rhodomonas_salina.1
MTIDDADPSGPGLVTGIVSVTELGAWCCPPAAAPPCCTATAPTPCCSVTVPCAGASNAEAGPN